MNDYRQLPYTQIVLQGDAGLFTREGLHTRWYVRWCLNCDRLYKACECYESATGPNVEYVQITGYPHEPSTS